MQVFVWQYVAKCTDNYHDGGGVVVFAATEKRARELANATEGCDIHPAELPSAAHALQFDCAEQVFIMPDAGCC